MAIVIFKEITCQNLDTFVMLDAMTQGGYAFKGLRFMSICPTTAKILEISNLPDGSWGGQKTKILAVVLAEDHQTVSDFMRAIWVNDTARSARYPSWIDPYTIATPRQESLYMTALNLERD